MMLGGTDIIVSKDCYRVIEDWSKCRSPSRAKRRHAKGIKTNMKVTHKPVSYVVGNKIVMHPTMYDDLRKHIQAQAPTQPSRSYRSPWV